MLLPPVEPLRAEGGSWLVLELLGDPRSAGGPDMLAGGRHLAHVRDVSAWAPGSRAALAAPAAIVDVGRYLLDPAASFRGVFDDGWLGADSVVHLAPAAAGDLLTIAGMVPGIGDLAAGNVLHVTAGAPDAADAVPVGRHELPPGPFRVQVRVPNDAPDGLALGLRFEKTIAPDGEHRALAAQLVSVTGEDGQATAAALVDLDFDAGPRASPGVLLAGVDTDGWLAREAALSLPPLPADTKVVLTVEMPGWFGVAERSLTVALGERELTPRVLTPGTHEIELGSADAPLASDAANGIALRFDDASPLPAPDTRTRAARLLRVTFRRP